MQSKLKFGWINNINTPVNPINTALHLLQPTFSFNKMAPEAVIIIGAKLIKHTNLQKGKVQVLRKENSANSLHAPLIKKMF